MEEDMEKVKNMMKMGKEYDEDGELLYEGNYLNGEISE